MTCTNDPKVTDYRCRIYADIAEEQERAIIGALGIQLPLTIRIETAELWADHPAGVPSWHRLARVPFSAHA